MFDELSKGVLCRGPEETAALAARLASSVREGTVALVGDLGAGKTTFAKGLARGLGVSAPVKSPSYSICMTYSGALSNFVHVDAYRLKSPEDYDSLLIDEIVPDPKLVCVEWPQIVAQALPHDALWIEILPSGEDSGSRLIRLLKS
mgnify:CR=1 FL=1